MFIIIVFEWVMIGRRDFFISRRLYFFLTDASLLTFFVGLFILFNFYCSHARVLGKTLVHEFPISYCHTEWYLIFSRNDMIELVEESPVRNQP